MPKMAQIRVNVILNAENFHTPEQLGPVTQMMSIMTWVSNPDRHLMKVLVLFLNPQMTADGSFWLIWTYQVQRGNSCQQTRGSSAWTGHDTGQMRGAAVTNVIINVGRIEQINGIKEVLSNISFKYQNCSSWWLVSVNIFQWLTFSFCRK